MQKLGRRNTNTPTDASQVRSNCDSVIKHHCGVGEVLQDLKAPPNNSDVNLPVSCDSGMEVETSHRKNHSPLTPLPEGRGIDGLNKLIKEQGIKPIDVDKEPDWDIPTEKEAADYFEALKKGTMEALKRKKKK